ncbi:uncharacterized protein [Epargyreus clarus]|uniref:uncharacterized protein n=1 Tax=Epargyreus clarus TaxID=520877 RepID=UPI003C2C0DE0
MGRYKCILFCVLLTLSITEPISAKRFSSGRHSYPKSGGLSGGGGHHSYPSSGGLSGGGHGYPSSGGSHAYPSSGGSHGYPSSGGNHGYPSSGGMSGNSHGSPGSGGYPSSGNTHHSGSHSYPAGKGLAGNTNTGHTTNVHYHYNYNPPQQIRYTPMHGGPAQSYPVYHGSPPTYVYKYKDSGSKYGTLLAGLALLNLGTVAAGAYAISHSHSNYKPQPGEVCKFGVKKDNGDYEETKIDCQLITSFIFQEQAKTQQSPNNTILTSTTVTNITTVNITNPGSTEAPTTTLKPNPVYEMLPNGTLVPINVTSVNSTTNATNDASSPGNTMTSSVTVTTTNTTTVSALDVKGAPIQVTPGMQCFVIRHSPTSNMRKTVPCGLLQTYADTSLKKNSAARNIPAFTILSIVVALFVMH